MKKLGELQLKILQLLDDGPCPISQLARRLGVGNKTVKESLRRLKKHELVYDWFQTIGPQDSQITFHFYASMRKDWRRRLAPAHDPLV